MRDALANCSDTHWTRRKQDFEIHESQYLAKESHIACLLSEGIRQISDGRGCEGILTMKNKNLDTVIRGPTPHTKTISSCLTHFGSQGRANANPAERQDVQGTEVVVYHERDRRYEELIASGSSSESPRDKGISGDR